MSAQGEVLGSPQQRCGAMQALGERLLEVAAVRSRVLLAQQSLPSSLFAKKLEKPVVLSRRKERKTRTATYGLQHH